MSGLVLIVLKYLTSLMTVAVTVAGEWFFDFTRTDKDTGRKNLTKWGRRAILVAACSLCLAAITTIWSDLDAARKRADVDATSKREKAALENSLSKLTNDMNTMVSLMRAYSSDDGKRETNRVVRDFSPIDVPKIEDALERAVSARIASRAECAQLPLESLARPGDPIRVVNKAAYVKIDSGTHFSIMVAPEGLRLSSIFGTPVSGFAFRFADGTLSGQVECGTSQYICSLWTHKNEFPASVYKLLQEKDIVSVNVATKTHKVSQENAALLRRLFSCLSP